jgi:hypothetical protein
MRSCGHAVMRPCGHAVMRPCGHAVMRPCGHAAMRACGHAGMRACGHAGMRACGHAGMRACDKMPWDPPCLLPRAPSASPLGEDMASIHPADRTTCRAPPSPPACVKWLSSSPRLRDCCVLPLNPHRCRRHRARLPSSAGRWALAHKAGSQTPMPSASPWTPMTSTVPSITPASPLWMSSSYMMHGGEAIPQTPPSTTRSCSRPATQRIYSSTWSGRRRDPLSLKCKPTTSCKNPPSGGLTYPTGHSITHSHIQHHH